MRRSIRRRPDELKKRASWTPSTALTVRRLVARLPRSYREALMLSAAGDYTFDEMSAALGVPAGTLKWRVSEARRQLREKLRALGYPG